MATDLINAMLFFFSSSNNSYTIILYRPSGNTRDVPLFTAYVSPNPNSSPSIRCNSNNVNGSPSNGVNASVAMSTPLSMPMNMNSSIRVHSPATATPAIRTPKEVAFRPKGR